MDKLGKFDRAIRALLAFENPNSCIRSLSNSLYQTIEISGYAVSDCLEANFKSVQNVTGDYLADIYASDVLLETSQKSYWKLLLAATCSPSLTKSFKGFNRNVTRICLIIRKLLIGCWRSQTNSRSPGMTRPLQSKVVSSKRRK